MAVDTRLKRFGLIGLGLPAPYLMPFPDADIDNTNDKAVLIYLYPNVAAVVAVVRREGLLTVKVGF